MTLRFSIELHGKDKFLLQRIQSFFSNREGPLLQLPTTFVVGWWRRGAQYLGYKVGSIRCKGKRWRSCLYCNFYLRINWCYNPTFFEISFIDSIMSRLSSIQISSWFNESQRTSDKWRFT
uniref:Uncharacterized protein n=1 Tax=Morchella brunnea TaxID=1174671 RepID=A0A8K1MH80_9PEZI|nr:hypothetical protein LK370_mgp136 [Morchella brunnea]UBU98386.1 hypothetical protein [Morchella brunnea]